MAKVPSKENVSDHRGRISVLYARNYDSQNKLLLNSCKFAVTWRDSITAKGEVIFQAAFNENGGVGARLCPHFRRR
jgi:hypothetical protein